MPRLVDITHAESVDRWRELLAGAGVKRASISGRGLFKDAASDALVRQAFFDGAIIDCQIVVPDFGTIDGAFQITSLEFAGEHNGEVTFDLALESRRRADVHGDLRSDHGQQYIAARSTPRSAAARRAPWC